jgi:neutral ceramidase
MNLTLLWTGLLLLGADGWYAGVGKATITPTTPMWMSGYGSRTRPAEGKLTDLWVKAVVLGDEKGPQAAILAFDLVGFDRDVGDALAGQTMKALKLPREGVLLNCSHTHSGPVVGGNLAPMYSLDSMQQALVDRYGLFLEAQTKTAVASALEDYSPAKLSFADDSVTFAVNRRNNPEKWVQLLRATDSLGGPVDYRVRVLAIQDLKGKLKAVLHSYACHATVLSGYEWCGDYPGYAAIELERRHPGATAVFLAGCGGDQNPLPRRSMKLAQQYGSMLADSVDRCLAKPRKPISPGVTFRAFERTPLRFAAIPSAADLDRAEGSKDKYEAARARLLKKQAAADARIADYYPYPVMTWRLGKELTWVALGGEVVVDYSLKLQKEFGDELWTLGYSHEVMAYIPSERVLAEGRYEGEGAMVYYGLPSKWKAGVEATVLGMVRDQIGLMNEAAKP